MNVLRSYLILFIIDLFQKTNLLHYYKFYLATKNWDRTQINEYQFKKIKDLLIYAKNNVPYYTQLFLEVGLKPEEIKSVEDIKIIPPLTRANIQEYNKSLVSKKISPKQVHKSSSSGTTGIPITYYYDNQSLSAGVAAGYFLCSFCNWRPGDKSLHIWGNPTSVKHWSKLTSRVKQRVKNQFNIASTEFNDIQNYKDILKFIYSHHFHSIDGYTSAIYELARCIQKEGLPKLSVNNVFTTAENLNEYQKEIMEKNIGNVSDLYGCSEVNGIAIKPFYSNKYYIAEPHVFVETEKIGEGLSEILITDLDNKSMPLIRYKVGDIIDNVYEGSDSNRIKYSYFKKVIGRSSEIIELTNGKKILPVNIVGGTLFRKIGGIIRHKVMWNGSELQFLFETNIDFNSSRAITMIREEFQDYGINIKVDVVDRLSPDQNGKFRYFEFVK